MERQNHHRGHRHDGAVLSIDYYAYASAIRGWNPYYKTAFSAACLILCGTFLCCRFPFCSSF